MARQTLLQIDWLYYRYRGQNYTYAHSKTVVQLVQATDHASKMGHLLFIPFYCNQWSKARGVLSPYWFAVYLDELSDQLGSARVGCIVGYVVVNHLMFADDICVFHPNISPLQRLLDICGDYMLLSPKSPQTIGVLFCSNRYKQSTPSNVFLNGVHVHFFDQVKYLGVLLNASLKDDDNIQRQVKSLYCAANKLRGTFTASTTFGQCSPAEKTFISCLLHANVCLPTVEQLHTQASMKRLRAAYNNTYRIMHCIPRNASVRPHQVNHRVKTFDALLRNNRYRFLQRCVSSSNFFYLISSNVWCFLEIFIFPQLLFNAPVWLLQTDIGLVVNALHHYLVVPVCRHVGKPSIQKVRHTTGKKLIAKSCFKIQENKLAVDLMINALESIWNLDRNSLHASVRQCATTSDSAYFYFFSLLVVYLKVWC